MSSETSIIDLHGDCWRPIPADQVLETAKGNLRRVVVVGIDGEGELYIATSDGDHEKAAALCLRAAGYLASMER